MERQGQRTHSGSDVLLQDLPQDVYLDADLMYGVLPESMHYNQDFKTTITEEQSVVKIPDDVDRNNSQVIHTVQWTAKLDQVFMANRRADPDIRWQYFGSSSGVHRMYPGREWPADFIGFHEDYDPRTRPWYVSAASGPKNIVIVLDVSTSMAQDGSLQRLKLVALKVLNTLTKQDYVNVVTSRSPYWNSAGVYHNKSHSVLSCHKSRLVPASTSNRKQLEEAINRLEAGGGSNHLEAFSVAFNLLQKASENEETGEDRCQSFIIFVTDGQATDDDHRCTPGQRNEESGEYVPGDVCDYDFDNVVHIVSILQYQRPVKAHLFTFLTINGESSRALPGKLACNNEGAMATVTSTSNVFQQMEPYFHFLQASSGVQSGLWTSPYLDKTGLGLIVTVAIPVYSNVTRRYIGVVGIDVPLQRIESLITHSLWGNVYAFMINREDGGAIFHPFTTPSAQLIDDPIFKPIVDLETYDGKPEAFNEVARQMALGVTGDVKITEDARRAVSVHNSLVWRSVEFSHYFFTDIPDSDFAIAFNLAKYDQVYQHAKDPDDTSADAKTVLHEMQKYRSREKYSELYDLLKLTDTHPLYYGINISREHSVVHLAPRAFCNPTLFLHHHYPTFEQVHEHVNTYIPTYDKACPEGTFKQDVRPDVKLSLRLEDAWKERHQELQTDIAWTYLGTMSGITRIYPGTQLDRDYDPTRRPWYQRAEANRGQLAVSSVYLDSNPAIGKLVTMSTAVHKAKPLTPPACTASSHKHRHHHLIRTSVPQRDYGCPCEHNNQCKSDYCYLETCADDVVQGVVAMDVRYSNFQRNFTQLIAETGVHKHCEQRYSCTGRVPCTTRCYLVDDMSYLVLDPEFNDLHDRDRSQYEDVSLASKQGHVFAALVAQGVFVQQVKVDYQGVCKISPSVPSSGNGSQSLPQKPDPPGPIPAFQNEHGCMQQVVYYQVNRTRLQQLGGTVVGDLEDDPCSDGTYYFTDIAGTNLLLLAIENYHQYKSAFNFNCRIRNSILRPGSFAVDETPCSDNEEHNVTLHPRSCVKPKDVPLPCGYTSSAVSWTNYSRTLWFLLGLLASRLSLCINILLEPIIR